LQVNSLPARLDHFPLDIEDIGDEFDKAVAIYEHPVSDGIGIDDMGMNARAIRFRCYFLNERYVLLKPFLAHVTTRDRICSLRHPAFGLIKGMVRKVSVRHDDRISTAELDIDFVEWNSTAGLSSSILAVVSAAQAAYRTGIASAIQTVGVSISAVVGAAEASNMMFTELSEGNALLQYSGLSRAGRLLVGSIDTAVSTVQGLVSTIDNPTNSILLTVDFGLTLPGRIIEACAQCVERQAEAIRNVIQTPAEFASNYGAALLDLRTAVPEFGTYLACMGALQGSLTLADLYDADEQSRQTLITQEKSAAFDIEGNLVRTDPPPAVATIDDLERSLASMRQTIQAAVDLDRSNDSLKESARALLRHINTVKLERERMLSVTITSTMPLHVLCLRYGLPYATAQRILALNPSIMNPTFVEGDVRIYAR